MSELVLQDIPCRLSFPKDLSEEDCDELKRIEKKLEGFIIVMTYPIKTLSEFKYIVFKSGLKWTEQNDSLIILFYEEKVMKMNWLGKWIIVSKEILKPESEFRNAIKSIIEAITDDFLIKMDNHITSPKEFLKTI